MIEVRWHARGGQGAVTASKILASSSIREGKYAQSAPDYGAERSGAPLRAFNRISEDPIYLHCLVLSPNVVIVVDPTLLETVPFLEGTNDDAILIINTGMTPEEVKRKFNTGNRRVFTVDATRIAMEEFKRPLMNVPMLGAFAKAVGVVGLNSIEEDIKSTFGKKVPEQLVKANINSLRRAYEEVKE